MILIVMLKYVCLCLINTNLWILGLYLNVCLKYIKCNIRDPGNMFKCMAKICAEDEYKLTDFGYMFKCTYMPNEGEVTDFENMYNCMGEICTFMNNNYIFMDPGNVFNKCMEIYTCMLKYNIRDPGNVFECMPEIYTCMLQYKITDFTYMFKLIAEKWSTENAWLTFIVDEDQVSGVENMCKCMAEICTKCMDEKYEVADSEICITDSENIQGFDKMWEYMNKTFCSKDI